MSQTNPGVTRRLRFVFLTLSAFSVVAITLSPMLARSLYRYVRIIGGANGGSPADIMSDVPDATINQLDALSNDKHSVAQLNLKTRQPGVVVCVPVSSPDNHPFAQGIGGWLDMTVPGIPEFGQSPALESRKRAAQELNVPDLSLTLTQAKRLASILGATHAAVGTLTDQGDSLVLAYRLYAIPSGAPVGAPVTVKGTRDAIVKQLPAVATRLVRYLGGDASKLPTTTGLTVEDLAFLGPWNGAASLWGTYPWNQSKSVYDITPAIQGRLRRLSSRSAFAAVVYFPYAVALSDTETHALAKTLFSLAPGNMLIPAYVATNSPLTILYYTQEVDARLEANPFNYCAAVASYRCHAQDKNDRLVRNAAEHMIESAPRNPDSWVFFGQTDYALADRIRREREYTQMTDAEIQYVTPLYPERLAVSERAVALDPTYGYAWTELAVAAGMMDGHTDRAREAVWKAVNLDPLWSQNFELARETYSPNEDKYSRMQSIIANVNIRTTGDLEAVASNLSGDERLEFLGRCIAKYRQRLQESPNDGIAHWWLAATYEASGRQDDSIAEYQNALKLLPDRVDLHREFQDALANSKSPDLAMITANGNEIVKLDPESQRLIGVGRRKMQSGNLAEAQAILKKAIEIYPSSAEAHTILGNVYDSEGDYAKAAAEYCTSLDVSQVYDYGSFFGTVQGLVVALDQSGGYDDALKYAKLLIRIGDSSPAVIDTVADVYLHKMEWERSRSISEYAISVDPSDGVAHANLGDALIQLGLKDTARSQWQLALASNSPAAQNEATQMLKKYP